MQTLACSEDASPPEVHCGAFRIDDRRPPLIVAELGINHDGQLQQAERLIDAARRCGADAVKFQIFTAEALVCASAPAAPYQAQAGYDSQRDMLEGLQLSHDGFRHLCVCCERAGILFLATPFSVEDLEFAHQLGVPAIKIASTDLTNRPLLEAAIAGGRPLILSTGGCHAHEIDAAVALCEQHKARPRLTLLHCVSSYPTADNEAALVNIRHLRDRYGVWSGYSDHTTAIDVGGLAVACGARILEKHLTLDHNLKGPDHAISLTPDAFRSYVDAARRAWSMMGERRRTPYRCEHAVRNTARRSVVSRSPIPKGQSITPQLLTLKRPAGGIDPQELQKVIGRQAACDIPADAQIQWSMLS